MAAWTSIVLKGEDISPSQERRTRYLKYGGACVALVILITFISAIFSSSAPIAMRIRYPRETGFDPRKLALLIENRPQPFIIPLLLHFSAVIPPEWRIQLMGSPELIALANASAAIRHQVSSGKMDLAFIPANVSLNGGELISQFLTSRYLYEELLSPAEWLLIWQTDSIICANSAHSLNDWLDYDYVGAPWVRADTFGGNGGLSMRRVSAMLDILDSQVRIPNSEPEDTWWSYRLAQRVGGRTANATIEAQFSIETVHGGKPMGYHIGHSAKQFAASVWGTYDLRKEVWEYCPEIKMLLDMEVEEYQDCPGTRPSWKKVDGRDEDDMYPLPAGLVPW